MSVKGKIVVTINDDGSINTNATGLKGSESDILKELNELAAILGGKLEVEKHVHGAHSHNHDSDHVHSH